MPIFSVVNGLLASGRIKAGDPVLYGPDSTGAFLPTVVKSIHRKRAEVKSAEAGQTVSLALKRVRRAGVRKGMVILQKTETPPQGESTEREYHTILADQVVFSAIQHPDDSRDRY